MPTPEDGSGRGRRRPPRQHGRGRDRDRRQGFGPYGAPRAPERERRPDDAVPERPARPSRLRVKGTRGAAEQRSTAARGRAKAPARRTARRRPPDDVEREVLGLGGSRGPYLLGRLMEAATAYAEDRDREALRLVRPVRDALPDAPSARELCGLAQYRLGNYRAAAKELEAFVDLTDSVEEHPVLMDCYRAQKRWRRVEELWDELAVSSPSARSEEHTSELQSHARISYAVFCLKKKKNMQ